jgi:putative transcriptional regulator
MRQAIQARHFERPSVRVHYRKFARSIKIKPTINPATNATAKAKSPLLEAVYETAANLHCLGFIDQRKIRKYEVSCQTSIPKNDRAKIRTLRDRFKLSQAVMASMLNISVSIVRQREIGDKHPSGPSQKLLHLLERKSLETLI